MALFFCISDAFDALEKIEDPRNRLAALIEISRLPPDCNGHVEDAFIFDDPEKILDLTADDATDKLATLLSDVPLFQFNIELLLDKALCERHQKAALQAALETAFGATGLPGAVEREETAGGEFMEALNHPMLGQMESKDLAAIYLRFLNALQAVPDEYGFEKGVLGRHTDRFTRHFSGFIGKENGKAVSEIVLAFGLRKDHDPSRSMDSYVEAGAKKAEAMALSDPLELIWSWLEADNFQMRRCRDIDRMMKIGRIKRQPQWIRADLFCFVEKEAMKQYFAGKLFGKDSKPKILEKTPHIAKAMDISAKEQVDEMLQKLLTQIMGVENVYSGSAAIFAEAAGARQREARLHSFL